MLKFFKKVRRKLIEAENLKKYLIYAIGEILLVMVGILLAIQVNEYKTKKNVQSEEIIFLNFVKQDLNKDIKDLSEVSSFKKMQLENSKEIIEYYKHSNKSIRDTLLFVDKIVSTFFLRNDNPNKTAFETAKTSGGIQKYYNKPLINSLSTYYSNNNMNIHLLETRRYMNSWGEKAFFNKYFQLGKSIYLSKGFVSEFMHIYEDDPRNTVTWIAAFREDLQMESYFQGLLIRLLIGIEFLDERERQAKSLVNSIDEYVNSIQ